MVPFGGTHGIQQNPNFNVLTSIVISQFPSQFPLTKLVLTLIYIYMDNCYSYIRHCFIRAVAPLYTFI